MVEEKFSIDLTKNGVQKTIYAKQGDTGLRKMSITLTSNGKVVSLAGYSLKALYDNDTYVSLENEGNPIEILLDGVICQSVGEHYCEILVYSEDNTQKLYSSQFRIIVEATIGGEDEAEVAQNPDHYVLAEEGKTLTSNDFTDADKEKLDGIESGAEANVQADWNEADSTADDFIKNKPVIPDITGKQDTLVSGENIKTVNGQSILGRGNMQVSAESIDWSNVQNKPDTLNGYGITDAYNKNETDTALSAKQNTLVSGSSIKTINGNSVLGSGNIEITSTEEADITFNISVDPTSGDFTGTVDLASKWNNDYYELATAVQYDNYSPKISGTIYDVTNQKTIIPVDLFFDTSALWVYYTIAETGIVFWLVIDGFGESTSVTAEEYGSYEQTTNKVTTLSSSSTDTEYPSAKCVYDAMQQGGGGGGGRIPAEYQEVEYIESTGTQYINTGVEATGQTGIDAELIVLSCENGFYFGCRTGNDTVSDNAFLLANVILTNSSRDDYGKTRSEFPVLSLSEKHRIVKVKGNTYVDGTVVASITEKFFTINTDISIFGVNTNGTVACYPGELRFCSFKIYVDGIIVSDFIPCYRKSDEVVGMYDVVNKAFHTNAGTGVFLKGADV